MKAWPPSYRSVLPNTPGVESILLYVCAACERAATQPMHVIATNPALSRWDCDLTDNMCSTEYPSKLSAVGGQTTGGRSRGTSRQVCHAGCPHYRGGGGGEFRRLD
jgi:hypothetical protein